MFDLFSRKKTRKTRPIEMGVNYFVKGKEVVFDLNGMDFTFGKFYLVVNEVGMYLIVKDEAPLNLINLLETVVDEVGVNRKQVRDSDEVDMILRLDDELFKKVKEEILRSTDPRNIFDIEYQGHRLLRVLTAYSLEEYSTYERKFNVYAKGPLVDAIKGRNR